MEPNLTVFISLVNNISIFIVLIAGYAYFCDHKLKHSDAIWKHVALGVFFGLVTIGAMHIKVPVAEGVRVDQRNAIVALAGAFGGPVTALINAIFAASYRAYLGGAGVLAGTTGAFLSAGAGVLLYYCRRNDDGAIKIFIGAIIATILIIPGFLLVGDLATGWALLQRMIVPWGGAMVVGITFGAIMLNREDRRLRIEQEKAETENRFKNFAEAASDWFWETDADLKYTYTSERFFELTGMTPEELYGQDRRKMIQDEMENAESEKWRHHFGQLERQEAFRGLEYKFTSKNGNVVHFIVNGTPVFDKDGNFDGYRGTGTDNSELVSTSEQLRQSQRMEAVGQLTGGIAHDFNNLLAVMVGNTEALEKRIAGDKDALNRLKKITDSVDRAASLTGRLLAFSRQQSLSPSNVAVNDLITNVEELLHRTLGESVRIRTVFDTRLWPATIDLHQCENAIVNLAINARDAMPEGGTLTIETANVSLDENYGDGYEFVAPGDYATISVSDTGTGMSDETKNKVFEPFFTTKDVGKGSGLGLSMVYGFVKQSNGHITIYSEIGHGTTVKLYLPRSLDAIVNEVKSTNSSALKKGSERILIVEDDENVREVPVSALKEQGYDVVEAIDGVSAIKCLNREEHFDLLFTDMVLPGGINGVDIAAEAKKLQPGIRILFTTGYAENAAIHSESLDASANLISKPYRSIALLERVRATLDSKSILVIESDKNLNSKYNIGLAQNGYCVTSALDDDEARNFISSYDFDVVVTDLVLENGNDMETLDWIHENSPKARVIAISDDTDHLDAVKKHGVLATLEKPFKIEDLAGVVKDVL